MQELRDMNVVRTVGRNTNNVRYADDMVLIIDSEEKLYNLADRRQEEDTMIGLKIKIGKAGVL